MRACRHLREVSVAKWVLPGKGAHRSLPGKPSRFICLIVSWMCAPAFTCVHRARACVPLQTQPPPHPLLQLTGRWMLAVTPAWICSCQMRWGHGESTKTLINLNHCPAFCWALPVVSNIYLVAADTGKSACAHKKQVAKPIGPSCRLALGSPKYRILLQPAPPHTVSLSLTDHGDGHHPHHH